MDIVGGVADEESRVMEFSSGRAFSPADREAIRLFGIDRKQMMLEYGKAECAEASDGVRIRFSEQSFSRARSLWGPTPLRVESGAKRALRRAGRGEDMGGRIALC